MDAVFIDTCVLFKAYVSDTLLSIAEAGALRPLWSDDVLKELGSNVAGDRISGRLEHNVGP
jgi:hypothetical protein